jgi:hypothetical protein
VSLPPSNEYVALTEGSSVEISRALAVTAVAPEAIIAAKIKDIICSFFIYLFLSLLLVKIIPYYARYFNEVILEKVHQNTKKPRNQSVFWLFYYTLDHIVKRLLRIPAAE